MIRRVVWCVLALVGVGCSSSDAPPVPGAPAPASGAPAVAATPAPAPPAVGYDARAVVARLDGGAQWFEWPALAGGRYGVFVFEAAQPLPVWAWEGTTTRVRFGDVANLEEDVQQMLRAEADRAGTAPRPPAGAQWAFLAFDAAGQVAGVRARGPL